MFDWADFIALFETISLKKKECVFLRSLIIMVGLSSLFGNSWKDLIIWPHALQSNTQLDKRERPLPSELKSLVWLILIRCILDCYYASTNQSFNIQHPSPVNPPPPRLLNFWEYPTQLPGFDGNTFLKSKSTTVTIYLPNFKIQTLQTFYFEFWAYYL